MHQYDELRHFSITHSSSITQDANSRQFKTPLSYSSPDAILTLSSGGVHMVIPSKDLILPEILPSITLRCQPSGGRIP